MLEQSRDFSPESGAEGRCEVFEFILCSATLSKRCKISDTENGRDAKRLTAEMKRYEIGFVETGDEMKWKNLKRDGAEVFVRTQKSPRNPGLENVYVCKYQYNIKRTEEALLNLGIYRVQNLFPSELPK